MRATRRPPLLALATLSALGLTAAPSAHAGSLTTTFASNNGLNGNMFDIDAVSAITINSFDINLAAGTDPVAVYYKTGTYVGSETNSAVWTLLGTTTVTSTAANTPTHLPLGGIAIPAGGVDGLYITTTDGGTMEYTNGTTGGPGYSNADLTITQGAGNAYPFGTNFAPRIWNGTVYYTAAPEPSSSASLCIGSLGAAGLILRTRRRNAGRR
jgi:hypothetical protein